MAQLIWDNIKNILKTLPKSAGIYQFFDESWKIIYIGKSVNLFSRVNSYFNGKAKLNFAKQKMVQKIANIKYILVENEVEALILETSLIKEHLPKYNILMKDGKNHIYIKITKEEWPKVIKTRFKSPPNPPLWGGNPFNKNIPPFKGGLGGATYFWPYISSQDIDNILKILKKIFGYWIGKHNFFKNKNNYNLDEFLFDWKIDLEDEEKIKKIYFEKLEKIKEVLKGNTKEIEEILKEKMFEFAKNHEFERAEIVKKRLESLTILKEKQIVRDGISWDYDIIYFLEKFDKTFVWVLELRDSKILGFFPYEIENAWEESSETIFKNFITQKYLNKILENKEKKINIITNSPLQRGTKGGLEKIFENLKIENPQKWVKADLLKMAYKNIYEFAYKKHIASLSTKGFTKQTMKNLLEILGFERINKDICFECNDISHFSGTHTVASRSVIVNWKLDKNKYKKFKIKTLNSWEINDFDSMREIAKRRILELEKLWNYPDLIIIDWWKGQLSSVYEIFKNIPLSQPFPPKEKGVRSKIQLVWIAKKEEILYVIEKNYPISESLPLSLREEGYKFKEYKLDKNSQELRLIQKLRDEAHRFAIGFNRDSRIKQNKKNILESIPWIWPKTRKKLLKEFWSVEKLKEAKKENLEKILNKNQIENLENHGII